MSETQMAEIKRFLMARYAEDEAAAREAMAYEGGDEQVAALPEPIFGHVVRNGPARVLAGCHVNRSFVEFATSAGAPWSPLPKGSPVGLNLLAILAEPFADHPDYRPEWRP